MGFIDPATIDNPTPGEIAPASWGDNVRNNLVYLVDRPQFVAGAAATQNITNTTSTVLDPAETELAGWDSNGMHSISSNTGRGTVITAGKYTCHAVVQWPGTVDLDGRRVHNFLHKNSAGTLIARYPAAVLVPIQDLTANFHWSLIASAGDYVEVEVWQNSGSTLACQLLQFGMRIEMR